MNRRRFLTAMAGLIAAPAIVRVGSIMPVSVVETEPAWRPLLRPMIYRPDVVAQCKPGLVSWGPNNDITDWFPEEWRT
jgi:hypothetical protein